MNKAEKDINRMTCEVYTKEIAYKVLSTLGAIVNIKKNIDNEPAICNGFDYIHILTTDKTIIKINKETLAAEIVNYQGVK